MSTVSVSLPSSSRGLATRVVAAGLTVGVLDAFGAMTHSLIIRGQARPLQIFRGIASVLIGDRAMSGGFATASLGLAMHFGVALTWAAVYGIVYSRWVGLRSFTRTTSGTVAAGLVFGPLVWLSMRFVVLPLLGETGPVHVWSFLLMVVIHMICVGLPIAGLVRTQSP